MRLQILKGMFGSYLKLFSVLKNKENNENMENMFDSQLFLVLINTKNIENTKFK